MLLTQVTRRRLAALLLSAVAAPRPAVAADAQAAWASVLRDRVDDLGRVDFEAIRHDPNPLAHYVAYVAATDPATLPAGAPRLAFLINAYNALAMSHVIADGIPRHLSLLGRLWFFKLTHVTIGHRRTNLYDFENDVIRPFGDPRVHFALNCMSVSCPRLPRVPFEAAQLDAQLDAGARLFFAEPRNVRIGPEPDTVHLSAILSFYTKDFLARAPTLIAYANLWRTDKIPPGDRVRFLPYDWTINRQPPHS